MQPKIIVGLSGKIGTGKTTLANLICKQIHGMSRISFADALRHEVSACYGVPMEWMLTQEGKARVVDKDVAGGHAVTVRDLLQMHGVFRREMDRDYWVKKTGDILTQNHHFIIDDVRFNNEAALVHLFGGIMLRIDTFPGWEPVPGAGHVSETALDLYDGFDLRIRPSYGTLEDFAPFLADWFRADKALDECLGRIRRLERGV